MELAPGVSIDEGRLRAICSANGIRRLGLFGSALHGRLRPDSDIDLLVEFEPARTPGLLASHSSSWTWGPCSADLSICGLLTISVDTSATRSPPRLASCMKPLDDVSCMDPAVKTHVGSGATLCGSTVGMDQLATAIGAPSVS